MYVRFQKKKLKNAEDYTLRVDIVRSYRDGKGRPRIASLGSIGSFQVREWIKDERGYYEREKFWASADKLFKRLSLPAEDEARLRRKLEFRIPLPPPPPKHTWYRMKERVTITYSEDDFVKR